LATIESTSDELYAEAFVGMGGMFLRRSFAPRVEVSNDRDHDVSNFFRILQRHYQARAEFEQLAVQNSERLTDLERAARFIYLQRLSFGGKSSSRSFGIDTTRLGPILEDIHDRLAGVTIECPDWRDFLERWDRPGLSFISIRPISALRAFTGPRSRGQTIRRWRTPSHK
jgi:DNA adenine methylase